MWYFTWVLGLELAVGFGVLNGIWHEFSLPLEDDPDALLDKLSAPPVTHPTTHPK